MTAMRIIGTCRLVVRTLLIAVWTLCLLAVRLSSLPLCMLAPWLELHVRRALLRLWGHGIRPLIGMRVIVKGTTPTPPFYLVSNHLSHLDAFLYAGILGCAFIAKSEVAKWPVFGFLAKRVNIVFIDRQKLRDALRVNEWIMNVLNSGDGMVLFAESTTSSGESIKPFKPALLEPAAKNEYPVHYATIHYQAPEGAPPASRWICWWQDEPFMQHVVHLLRMPGFTATVTFGPEPIVASDRKILAEKLHEACLAQFTPVE
ncbi:MAG TPA: 1-acyl-sn-glycerol-3-phosphate acyltransferase [Candidatus Hydrogenedentes bacterium]|nr:1-acyl-sn-glycerol-3-phosphate acyltransferase [Candidatus Hydrogenedentota bacterium]